MVLAESPPERERYEPHGALRALFESTDPEIVVEGPSGTGKTFAICHLLDLICVNYPGARILFCRKTHRALTATSLVTFKKVFRPEDCEFFGGNMAEPASYRYKNGSRIVVGGLDNPDKLLSSEYDIAYVNEATEITEEQWETIGTRLRNGVLKRPRLIGDCNPSYERHWLLKRVLTGKAKRIQSTHEDNPTITPQYLERLKNLTGTRHQRFFLGQWIGLENAIYPQLDGSQMQPLPERVVWTGHGATGIDYGRVHLSAVCTLTRASDGRVWVRECWAEPGGNSAAIEDAARSHRIRFGPIRRGVVDPIQGVLAQKLPGFKIANSGDGARKGRIERVTKYLDAGALLFDRWGDGVQELYDELCMYRYEVKETDYEIKDVIVRKGEDRVAALEYAIEALETTVEIPAFRAPRSVLQTVRSVTIGKLR